jgi:heme A synthase
MLVAALLVWAFRAYPKRHRVRLGAALSATFLVTEALLGASLVLLNHVARNASSSRAWSLSAHLINTLTAAGFLALTAWWGSGRPAVRLARPRGVDGRRDAGGVFAVLGVSGAIAALGDTLFPVTSLAAGFARDFDPSANLFVRLRVWHPLLAAAAGAWVLYYALSAVSSAWDGACPTPCWRSRAASLPPASSTCCCWRPVGMQLVHLLLADLLWIALVLLSAERLRA